MLELFLCCCALLLLSCTSPREGSFPACDPRGWQVQAPACPQGTSIKENINSSSKKE